MHLLDVLIRLISPKKIKIPASMGVTIPYGVQFRRNRLLTRMFGSFATTFNKTIIVCSGPLPRHRVLHELVHVEQYRAIGVLRFLFLYVKLGVTSGFGRKHPLEIPGYAVGDNNRYYDEPTILVP
jgi:hypothetical protein